MKENTDAYKRIISILVQLKPKYVLLLLISEKMRGIDDR